MNFPLVSIQIPTYNQKDFIKEALDSALAQTYENLEIIVSDDCSPTYDIFEYLQDYKDNSKVKIYRNDENLGRVGNYRYTLYNLVKGEWFINLDGDDFLTDNNFVQQAISSINYSKNKIAVFYANANLNKIVENKIKYFKINNEQYEVKGLDYLYCLSNRVRFSHASLIFDTQLAKSANFYNLDILSVDYYSFLKIIKYGNIIFWDKKVYKWRIHQNQASWTLDFNKVSKKYSALDDLKNNYIDINLVDKEKIFLMLDFIIYKQLITAFFDENITLQKSQIIAKKIKYKYKYIQYFIKSLIRRIGSKVQFIKIIN